MLAKGRGGCVPVVDGCEAVAGVREVAAGPGRDTAVCRARTKSSLSKNPEVEMPLKCPMSTSQKNQLAQMACGAEQHKAAAATVRLQESSTPLRSCCGVPLRVKIEAVLQLLLQLQGCAENKT